MEFFPFGDPDDPMHHLYDGLSLAEIRERQRYAARRHPESLRWMKAAGRQCATDMQNFAIEVLTGRKP